MQCAQRYDVLKSVNIHELIIILWCLQSRSWHGNLVIARGVVICLHLCTHNIYIDNEHFDDLKPSGKIPKYVTSQGPFYFLNQGLVARLLAHLDMQLRIKLLSYLHCIFMCLLYMPYVV